MLSIREASQLVIFHRRPDSLGREVLVPKAGSYLVHPGLSFQKGLLFCLILLLYITRPKTTVPTHTRKD